MGKELRALLRLAFPVILAELGWMGMGVVDTIMVGRISPEAIGAVAIGNILFNTIGLLAFSLLLGLDTLISQAVGAGHHADARHSLRQGFWVALLTAPPLSLLMAGCVPLMGLWGLDAKVYDLAVPFSYILSLSVLPIAFYTAQRRYLQCLHLVRPVSVALLTANLVNFGLNALLIPRHGVSGSAWATVGARIYLAGFLYVVLRRFDEDAPRWEAPDWGRIAQLLRLGLPAAGHIFSEIAVFGAATALAGRFPAIALAAHEVTLNHASLAYMVPLGISSAAAVRVGNAIGARDLGGSRRAGHAALLSGAAFMSLSALLMFLFPREILAIYTNDALVIAYAVPLLFWAAAFQLFDGIQVVATGALRGRGDTRAPFAASLLGYWVIGLPVGAWLCFWRGQGVTGLWIGLSLGLALVAVVLLIRWLWALGLPELHHAKVVAVDGEEPKA
ncbi:MAG: MATE family efflux transporter [Bryobacter sp.]|jgi:MATE family multidrug resistance protein|nr:MATE family efflux transporter [Bryobacter sp. CoA8 C33]